METKRRVKSTISLIISMSKSSRGNRGSPCRLILSYSCFRLQVYCLTRIERIMHIQEAKRKQYFSEKSRSRGLIKNPDEMAPAKMDAEKIPAHFFR
jgi:hypothetical protein